MFREATRHHLVVGRLKGGATEVPAFFYAHAATISERIRAEAAQRQRDAGRYCSRAVFHRCQRGRSSLLARCHHQLLSHTRQADESILDLLLIGVRCVQQGDLDEKQCCTGTAGGTEGQAPDGL